MVNSEVIIVGGGPAGTACAWKLKQAGRSVLILEKKAFPREKLCAGWITPQVLRLLEVRPADYPFGLLEFRRLHFHFRRLCLPLKTRQYSIRRYEFDHWLAQRCGADIHLHRVERIARSGDEYVIDERYRCRYLIGAGGTQCPVYRILFASQTPRAASAHISTLEEEFRYPIADSRCHLWFFDDGLGGYAWYVPKPDGYLNVGIGGKLEGLKRNDTNIRRHWNGLVRKLDRLGLVRNREFQPKSWGYYLRQPQQTIQRENARLIGDAAGLATVDMGEGIGPAIHSGILAAQSLIDGTPLRLDPIGRWSFRNLLFPGC